MRYSVSDILKTKVGSQVENVKALSRSLIKKSTDEVEVPAIPATVRVLSQFRLFLGVPPSTNVYYRNFRGHMVISKEGREYKKEVAVKGAEQGARVLSGNIALSVIWYRARRAGDLDNFTTKSLWDSLKGVAFEDDSQITEFHSFRRDDKKNPRVEVEIRQIP